jgi:CRP-like cAMP-binding protein
VNLVDRERLARELFMRATFPAMPGDAVARLSDSLLPLEVSAGTMLFQPGEAAHQLYFVVEGEIAMESPGEASWVFGARSMVGIIDVLLSRPRARSARATATTRLYVLRASAWLDMLEDDPALARAATSNVARRLHHQWIRIAAELPRREIVEQALPQFPLPLYEKVLTLRDSALLQRAGAQAIASLAQYTEELRFEPGATVFEAGTVSDVLYVVAYGAVELSRAAPSLHVVHAAGDVLGGAAALCRELSPYSARALRPSVVLKIRDEDYFDQAEEHPELIRAALAYLVAELEPLFRIQPPVA